MLLYKWMTYEARGAIFFSFNGSILAGGYTILMHGQIGKV